MHTEKLSQQFTASFQTETQKGEDRRSSPRVQTVFRVARVQTDSDEGFARIQNISNDGVKLQLHLPVLLGDALAIELADGVSVGGKVVWTCGVDCGLRLNNPIDSSALLRDLAAHARTAIARPLRLKVAAPAVSRGANGTRAVQIADVSQRGMKLKHDGSFEEGLQVKITLSSGRERRGVVRWSKDMIAGVMLLEPFSAEELGSMSNL